MNFIGTNHRVYTREGSQGDKSLIITAASPMVGTPINLDQDLIGYVALIKDPMMSLAFVDLRNGKRCRNVWKGGQSLLLVMPVLSH